MSLFKSAIFDIEANNLLYPLLDFSSLPYKLKPEAKLWCIVVRGINKEPGQTYTLEEEVKLLVPSQFLNVKYPTHKVDYFNPDDNTLVHTEYYTPEGELIDDPWTSSIPASACIKSGKTEIEDAIWYNNFPKLEATKENLKLVFKDTEKVIGHNIINYDLPMLMLFGLLDYTVGYPGLPSTLFDKDVEIVDTLIWSKTFFPDRMDSYGRHGLAAWGKRSGDYKLAFDDFSKFSAGMCFYCMHDTKANLGALELLQLEKEEDGWSEHWDKALTVEHKLMDLTLRQEVVGFEFDVELAKNNLERLDVLLQEREDIVLPGLPPKPMTKVMLDSFTPPAKQFLKSGKPNANITKFAAKVGGSIETIPPKTEEDSETYVFKYKDFEWPLPHNEPLETHIAAEMKDNEHIKGHLLHIGWKPTEWGERDLTKDSKKKVMEPEKVYAAINRYVEKTYSIDSYRIARLEELLIDPKTDKEDFREMLIDMYQKSPKKPLRVPTSPKVKVGTDKEVDRALLKLEGQEGVGKALGEYYTYKHRRSSISGGDVDEETGEPTKGYLSAVREEDNRIPTPADTIGAGCVIKGTQLITSLGYKCITEMQIGDLVLTHLGRYKPVTDVIDNGVKPTFTVTLANGKSLTCTDNHPFWTDTGWIRCRDLVVNSTLVFTYPALDLSVEDIPEFDISVVVEIEAKGDQQTYDITVEDDHSYVADNIVTHNTYRYTHRVVANVARNTSLFGTEMRGMFTAGKSWIQAAFDFASLEARVQGNHIVDFEGGIELAATLLASKPNDIHCYSEDTEILTPNGWCTFGKITKDTLVAQYDNGVITFVKPSEIVWQEYSGSMVHIKNKETDMLLTPNHRVVTYAKQSNTYFIDRADYFLDSKSQHAYPVSGVLSPTEEIKISEVQSELVFLLQVFGERIDTDYNITVSGQNKIDKLLSVLNSLKAVYVAYSNSSKGKKSLTVRISYSQVQTLLDGTGVFIELPDYSESVLLIPLASLSMSVKLHLLQAVGFWLGTYKNNGDIVVSGLDESSATFYQQLAISSGYKAIMTSSIKNGEEMYKLTISTRLTSSFKQQAKLVSYTGMIGCVAVNSGVVVVRRNNKVFISGNTVTAKKLGISRDDAKSINYAVLYGAQWAKLKKMLGISESEAKKMYEDFWDSMPPLKVLKERLENYWEETGKRYIRAIDGRKIRIRSQHSLINFLFQGNGAILSKWSAVRIAQEFESQGLLGDPFKHKEEDLKVWQLILYHDEVQYAIHRKLMKVKVFNALTEEEKEAYESEMTAYKALTKEEQALTSKPLSRQEKDEIQYQEDNKHLGQFGDLVHLPDNRSYIGLPGVFSETLLKGVEVASKENDLKVELGISWVTGDSWATCH